MNENALLFFGILLINGLIEVEDANLVSL